MSSFLWIRLASRLVTRVATRPNVGHTPSKGIGEGVAAGRRPGVLTVEWRLNSRILQAKYEILLVDIRLDTRVATRPNVGHTPSKGIGEGVAAGRLVGLQI
jgi:hypothetical protein